MHQLRLGWKHCIYTSTSVPRHNLPISSFCDSVAVFYNADLLASLMLELQRCFFYALIDWIFTLSLDRGNHRSPRLTSPVYVTGRPTALIADFKQSIISTRNKVSSDQCFHRCKFSYVFDRASLIAREITGARWPGNTPISPYVIHLGTKLSIPLQYQK